MPDLMNGKRSSISSWVKYSVTGASAPCWMNSASWKESTVAQSGARPARACSSMRACSLPISGVKYSMLICQSGWFCANWVKSCLKPSAWLGVVLVCVNGGLVR